MSIDERLADTAMGGIEDRWLSPIERQPDDIEVPLQTMVVRLPDDPMSINGVPYAIDVNAERLTTVVNNVRVGRPRPGIYEPRALSVVYGESLHPKIAGTEHEPDSPVFVWQSRELRIVTPREHVQSSLAHGIVAREVQDYLNSELLNGLSQEAAMKAREGLTVGARISSLVVAALLGEGGGILLGNGTLPDAIWEGSGGALVGMAGIASVIGLKDKYYELRRGGDEAVTARAAIKRVAKIRQNSKKYPLIPAEYFEKPIILVTQDKSPELQAVA